MISEILIIIVGFAIISFFVWDYVKLTEGTNPKYPICKSSKRVKEIKKFSLAPGFKQSNSQLHRVYFKCKKCKYKWSEMKEIAEKTYGRRSL